MVSFQRKNQSDVPLNAKMIESTANFYCQKNCSKHGIIFTDYIVSVFNLSTIDIAEVQ